MSRGGGTGLMIWNEYHPPEFVFNCGASRRHPPARLYLISRGVWRRYEKMLENSFFIKERTILLVDCIHVVFKPVDEEE